MNKACKRTKRSIYQKKYLSKTPQKHSVILDSDQIVLPFYQVKEEDSSEEDLVQSPYSNINRSNREELLRKIIRRELQKFKTEKSHNSNNLNPAYFDNMVPHSPVFHLLHFPLTLLKKFLPLITSVPKLVVGSKKYFRDFGKNFRKNLLHFASDVIGDFDGLETNNNILEDIITPKRYRRNIDDKNNPEIEGRIQNEHIKNNDSNSDVNIRKKRYLLKMVDEYEVEEFLMEKLGGLFDSSKEEILSSKRAVPKKQTPKEDCPYCHLFISDTSDTYEGYTTEKTVVLEQVKPRLILDNNGRPFLEIDGYKKPIPKRRKAKRREHVTYDDGEEFPYFDSSEETNSERISYLIDHARDRLEAHLSQRKVEMPIITIKEKMSRMLFETDMLVHLDFEKYDGIYDDLINLQGVKNSVVQDWKRLLMSKRINDINAKISLLQRFHEMQHIKDQCLKKVVHALKEDKENKFCTKNLIKILVRLQKLQCVINEVVDKFQEKLHMRTKFDTQKEIQHVEFLADLNFVNAKTRNDAISNLKKERDVALQKNILLLNKLKKLLIYEHDSEKINEEAGLMWEMGNLLKMQRSTIDEMHERFTRGQKIKKELKILFDLLKRYDACEAEQKKLLSRFDRNSSEEEPSEKVSKKAKNTLLEQRKFDIEEFRRNWQERLKKQKMLLKKNLRKNVRRRYSKNQSAESDYD